MIAADQALVTVQALHDFNASFLALKKRVAEDIHGVITTNALVPPADDLLVHLPGVGKRPLVIFEYILMPKMHIGDVEYSALEHHSYLLTFFASPNGISLPHLLR